MDENVLGEKLKSVQLELLIELDRVCRKNNLRYFLAYGTLIGAVRHNGFIPWDDDIDVMMPYEDMKKLESIWSEEASEKYFFQSPDTDPEYRLSINRIRKNGTLLVEPLFKDKNVHKGIFLDIYPVFGAAEGWFNSKLQVFRAMKRALYLLDEPVRNHGAIMKIGSTILLKLKSKKGKDKAQKKLFKKIALDYDAYSQVKCLDSTIKKMITVFEKKWFSEGIDHEFEGYKAVIPNDSDAILSLLYGDYMQLPPIEQQKYHHNFLQISFGDDCGIDD